MQTDNSAEVRTVILIGIVSAVDRIAVLVVAEPVVKRCVCKSGNFLCRTRTVFIDEGVARIFAAPFGRHVELHSRHIVNVGIAGKKSVESLVGECIVVLSRSDPAAVENRGVTAYSGVSEGIVYAAVLFKVA